jgi:hypothetical protein
MDPVFLYSRAARHVHFPTSCVNVKVGVVQDTLEIRFCSYSSDERAKWGTTSVRFFVAC